MTSHWPTFADGLFWCACDNGTFDTEEAWTRHVAVEVLVELRCDVPGALWPSESSVRHDAPSR